MDTKDDKPAETSPSNDVGCSGVSFDQVVMQVLNGPEPADLSACDHNEFAVFALKEAYYHIRGRAPNTPEDDELSSRSRCAGFVCAALLAALETLGDEESLGW